MILCLCSSNLRPKPYSGSRFDGTKEGTGLVAKEGAKGGVAVVEGNLVSSAVVPVVKMKEDDGDDGYWGLRSCRVWNGCSGMMSASLGTEE